MEPTQPSKLAILSLVVSVIGVAAYTLAIRGRSLQAYPLPTGLGLLASLVSLGLSIFARIKNEQRWLCMLSLAVAIAFVLTMGIMLLSILVYSLR